MTSGRKSLFIKCKKAKLYMLKCQAFPDCKLILKTRAVILWIRDQNHKPVPKPGKIPDPWITKFKNRNLKPDLKPHIKLFRCMFQRLVLYCKLFRTEPMEEKNSDSEPRTELHPNFMLHQRRLLYHGIHNL